MMKKTNNISDLTDKKKANIGEKSYNYGDLVIMIWRRIKLNKQIPVLTI
jgi:hypothetical protein